LWRLDESSIIVRDLGDLRDIAGLQKFLDCEGMPGDI
jgi:hypothetical protein